MELIAVIVGIVTHVEFYKEKSLLIRCDNTNAISWLETQRGSFQSRNESLVCVCLKYLFRILIDNKVYIQLKYIASDDNTYADRLSRYKPRPFQAIQRDQLNWIPKPNPSNVHGIVDKIVDNFVVEFPNSL